VSIERAAAGFLLFVPLAFNLFFFLLGRQFDYPNVLRNRTEDILGRFHAGGVRLKLMWYGFMLTAVLLAPLAVLLGQVFDRDRLAIGPMTVVVGVLPALVQFVGLARWPFLVPVLARTYHDPSASEARREATVVIFESFHRYLGVAIGECLGYLLTGVWTVLVGAAMLQSSIFGGWLAWPGITIGVLLILGSVEFVGSFEEKGWKLAGTIVPIAYTAWSLWLVGTGLVLLAA
jgi:hypothetical protein